MCWNWWPATPLHCIVEGAGPLMLDVGACAVTALSSSFGCDSRPNLVVVVAFRPPRLETVQYHSSTNARAVLKDNPARKK